MSATAAAVAAYETYVRLSSEAERAYQQFALEAGGALRAGVGLRLLADDLRNVEEAHDDVDRDLGASNGQLTYITRLSALLALPNDVAWPQGPRPSTGKLLRVISKAQKIRKHEFIDNLLAQATSQASAYVALLKVASESAPKRRAA